MIFGVALVAMFVLWMRDMRIAAADRGWLKAVRHYATRRRLPVLEAGKYNGGQKMFFWLQCALGVLLIVTGVPLWMPTGGFGLGGFGPTLLTVCRLAHYASGLAAGLLLIPHVYLGTIALPGTLRGMIDGRVSREWARHHHPRWEHEKTNQ